MNNECSNNLEFMHTRSICEMSADISIKALLKKAVHSTIF